MSTNILQNYGKAIRVLRQERNISQEELAELCGLHRTYISDVELGKRNVSLENIQKFAIALNVSISDVFLTIERNVMKDEGF